MSGRDQGMVETVREALRGEEGASTGTTFMRGLTLGALIGAAVAGSAIWQRRGRRRLAAARHGPGHRRRPRRPCWTPRLARTTLRKARSPGRGRAGFAGGAAAGAAGGMRRRRSGLAIQHQGLIRQRARMTHQPAPVDAGRRGHLGVMHGHGLAQDRAASGSASTSSASGQAQDGQVHRSRASSLTASSFDAQVRRTSTEPHFVHLRATRAIADPPFLRRHDRSPGLGHEGIAGSGAGVEETFRSPGPERRPRGRAWYRYGRCRFPPTNPTPGSRRCPPPRSGGGSSTSSPSAATRSCRALPSSRPATRRCSSRTRGWCSSRTR